MLSLSTTALMATYLISIGSVLNRRLRGPKLPVARWSLGKLGMPVNILALMYAAWSLFWSFWPNAYEPTLLTFNWVVVLFVGLMAVSGILYFTHARKIYTGPVARVVADLDMNTGGRAEDDVYK